MALVPGNVGDNPFQPGVTAEIYNPDQLIAGDLKIVTTDITVLHLAALLRGTVMGKITLGAVTSAAKAGGNTGTGTLTVDVVTPLLANARQGVYTVRFTAAAANNGTFRVVDPNGAVLGDVVMAGGAGAFADQVKFAVADGGVDFIVGDGFDITVAAGSGKFIKAVKTAVDGSQAPQGILVDDADASVADVNAGLYQTGEFNGSRIIYDGSFTLGDITDAFRRLGIFIKSAITNADPT